MKPLLERKRRARINKCLDELKDIMTVALQAQGENVSKLEKADILELTVRHLHKLQQAQRLMPTAASLRNPLEEVHRFQAGYSSCAQEAASFLLQSPGVDVAVSQRLLSHLTSTSTLAAAQSPFGRLQAGLPTPPSSSSSTLNGGSSLSPAATPPSVVPAHSPDSKVSLPLYSQSPFTSLRSLSTGSRPFHSPPLKSSSASSPPPRPSSNPEQTVGTFTVAIRKASSEPERRNNNNDDCLSEDEDSESEEEDDEPKGKRRRRRLIPVRPEAVRLNPNDPVWRPF